MNIDLIRQSSKLEPGKYVLHIGEDNLKYWLDSYQASKYQKVFMTSPSFYTRGYDTSALERATVEKYTSPQYYFIKCRIKDDGLLSAGLDDSYSSDMDFRMAYDQEKIKALVIDENPEKKETIKLFLEKAKTVLTLCRPEMVYVREGLEQLIEDYAVKQGLSPVYYFDVGMIKTLNKEGNVICSYNVYLKDAK